MPIKVLQRFVIYPLIFMAIMLMLFIKFDGSGVTNFLHTFVFTLYEAIEKTIPIALSENMFVGMVGFFMGYVYGTISLGIQVRKVRGFLQIILGIIKVMISLVMVLFGFMLYFAELLVMPFVYLGMRKYKKAKKVKRDEEMIELMKRAIREENNPSPPPPVYQEKVGE